MVHLMYVVSFLAVESRTISVFEAPIIGNQDRFVDDIQQNSLVHVLKTYLVVIPFACLAVS